MNSTYATLTSPDGWVRIFANGEWVMARVLTTRSVYSMVEYYDHRMGRHIIRKVRKTA